MKCKNATKNVSKHTLCTVLPIQDKQSFASSIIFSVSCLCTYSGYHFMRYIRFRQNSFPHQFSARDNAVTCKIYTCNLYIGHLLLRLSMFIKRILTWRRLLIFIRLLYLVGKPRIGVISSNILSDTLSDHSHSLRSQVHIVPNSVLAGLQQDRRR